MKCFIEDKGKIENIALTLLHSESGRIFKGILSAKYKHDAFFLGLGRNDWLGHGFSINWHGSDSFMALNLLWCGH